MIKRIFMCECSCGGLIIDKFDDESQIYLQKLGQPLQLDWKRKLKTCWKILTNDYKDW